MKLVGLCGYAGAGKDHVYQLLRDFFEEPQKPVIRVALADNVRIEIEIALGIGYIPALWNKPYPEEIRKLLQWWGTDYRRGEDDGYWVDRTRRYIKELTKSYPDALIVVTDVRFADEAAMIQELGGMVCQVLAPEKTRAERLGGTIPPTHASEVIDFDATCYIQNEYRAVLGIALTQYLGLPPSCTKCRTLSSHPWCDNGDWNYHHKTAPGSEGIPY